MQRKTLSVPVWALVCIQTFGIWQMGMIYYSSQSLTVGGSAPLPVSADATVLPIALGYLAGTALDYFCPRTAGLWARIISVASAACLLLMLAPLPGSVLALLYYLAVFACVCYIGIIGLIAINLYSIKTALLDGILGTLVSSPFIALLNLSSFQLDFRRWIIISVAIQVLMQLGLTQIPPKADTEFLPRQRSLPLEERTSPPAKLLAGTAFVYTVACLCILFSSTSAESLPNGISLYNIAGAGWTALFAYLHYARRINPLRLYTIFLGVAALGFILWLLPVPALMPVSLILQGVNIGLASLAWFLASMLFERWNSRTVAPAAVLIALLTVLLHSALLELLRGNTELLYAVYAAIALALLVVYFLCEPYFRRVWIDSGDEEPRDAPDGERGAQYGDIAALGTLSRRETEVMELAVRGYNNSDIAKMLYISENTLKDHMKRIYQKLNVHSRFELVATVNRAQTRRAPAGRRTE